MTGILDEYPGSYAAYSLRLVNTDYTGDCVTVRRASDNTTANIGFVDGVLDVDTLETFCTGTDGFVAVWFDQSGNGENAVNATASAQPKIHDATTGVVLYEGNAAVQFNGTTHWLDATLVSSQFSQLFSVTNGTTGVVAGFSGQVFLENNRYNTSDDDIEFDQSDGLFVVDNLNVEAYVNNIDKTNGATTFTQVFNRFIVGSVNGSTLFFSGQIQEIIAYPYATDQSGNRIDIQNNINDYYNIY